MKKRCQGCGKSTLSNPMEQAKIPGTNALQAMSQFRKRASRTKTPDQPKVPELKLALSSEDPLGIENQRPDQDSQSTPKPVEPVLRCKFHDGVIKAKVISKISGIIVSASLRHLPVPALVMLRAETISGSLFRQRAPHPSSIPQRRARALLEDSAYANTSFVQRYSAGCRHRLRNGHRCIRRFRADPRHAGGLFHFRRPP